jgi:hypothetical protein
MGWAKAHEFFSQTWLILAFLLSSAWPLTPLEQNRGHRPMNIHQGFSSLQGLRKVMKIPNTPKDASYKSAQDCLFKFSVMRVLGINGLNP